MFSNVSIGFCVEKLPRGTNSKLSESPPRGPLPLALRSTRMDQHLALLRLSSPPAPSQLPFVLPCELTLSQWSVCDTYRCPIITAYTFNLRTVRPVVSQGVGRVDSAWSAQEHAWGRSVSAYVILTFPEYESLSKTSQSSCLKKRKEGSGVARSCSVT